MTAAPCFKHTADYSGLTGQVEYSRIAKGWRLRYASVDEIDLYGGSVNLIENRDLDHIKDGQYISVCGHLVNPADAGTSPAYRVDSIKWIGNGDSAEQK